MHNNSVTAPLQYVAKGYCTCTYTESHSLSSLQNTPTPNNLAIIIRTMEHKGPKENVLIIDISHNSSAISELRDNFIAMTNSEINVVISSKYVDIDAVTVVVSGSVNLQSLEFLRNNHPHSFIAVFDAIIAKKPSARLSCFNAGVNMVTSECSDLIKVFMLAIWKVGKKMGALSCPLCGMPGLTETELWYHCPTYHINMLEQKLRCPICETSAEPVQPHIHYRHKPIEVPDFPSEKAVPICSFSLVVCRHPTTGKFLLCQESANKGFWLPGGGVCNQEKLSVAGIREIKEEAGIDVDLKGILAIEQTNGKRCSRQRVIFYAEPKDVNQVPKTIPDYESAGACWCSAEEILGGLRLRGNEPKQWVEYLANEGIVHPLSLLHEY